MRAARSWKRISNGFVEAKKSGHWVHIMEPELVVDEVVRMNKEIVHVS